MVEQRHGVAHAEVPEDPDGALLGHAATELHDPRARAACRRHHVGIIPLSKQPLGPVLARIGLCDIHERLGMIGEGLFVADLDPAVPASAHQLLGRRARDRIAREALVHPFLEALSQERAVDAPVAVKAPREHQALLAAARIPARRGLVAVKVLRFRVTVSGLDANDDVVFDVGVEKTVMRVIRAAKECETRVRPVDIAVNALPIPIGVGGQRVVDIDRRQIAELGHRRLRQDRRSYAACDKLEKSTAGLCRAGFDGHGGQSFRCRSEPVFDSWPTEDRRP